MHKIGLNYIVIVLRPLGLRLNTQLLLEDNLSKQYSAIHYPLKNCNNLTNFSLVAIQLPDTVFENSILTERNKTKHKIPSTRSGPIFKIWVELSSSEIV